MATVETMPAVQHSVLHGVAWHTYRELRDAPENEHIRMTYDRGVLEIMSPSPAHEGYAYIVGRLIDIWTAERNIPIRSLRSMTCQREDMERGFEPDNCYYVQNELRMWNKTEFSLSVAPPPDLAVEIDVTRSSLDKLAIYAAFGVPELWLFNGRALRVYELRQDGQYHQRESSVCFPELPISEVERVLRQVGKVRETQLAREFQEWVRKTLPGGA
jgi:Uma2 family endonuclease